MGGQMISQIAQHHVATQQNNRTMEGKLGMSDLQAHAEAFAAKNGIPVEKALQELQSPFAMKRGHHQDVTVDEINKFLTERLLTKEQDGASSLAQFDTDGDGKLTKDELAKGLSPQGDSSNMSLAAQVGNDDLVKFTMGKYDLNGDGTISVKSDIKKQEVVEGQKFKQYDADNDGKLSKDELSKGLGGNDWLAGVLMEKYDKDNDGSLSVAADAPPSLSALPAQDSAPKPLSNADLARKLDMSESTAHAAAYIAKNGFQAGRLLDPFMSGFGGIKNDVTADEIHKYLSDELIPKEQRQASGMAKYDADGDGKVTRAELANGLVNGKASSSAEEVRNNEMLNFLQDKYDLNGDGVINVEADVKKQEIAQNQNLKQYDADKDGKVTKQELSAGLGDNDWLADILLDKYDKDKDGNADVGTAPPMVSIGRPVPPPGPVPVLTVPIDVPLSSPETPTNIDFAPLSSIDVPLSSPETPTNIDFAPLSSIDVLLSSPETPTNIDFAPLS